MKSIVLYFFTVIAFFTAGCSGQKQAQRGSRAPLSLTVMAYNVHHCNPPSRPGVIDVDAVAAAIRKQNAHLVALQEIDVNTARSGPINQAALLAQKAGYPFYYFAKAINYDGGEYGVAILSRFPLSHMQTLPLPTVAATKGEPRVLSLATVTLPGGRTMRFGSTHLDAQRTDTNRLLQAQEIVRATAAIQEPIIIAGDFNAVENSGPIRTLDSLFTRTCSPCAPTIPEVNPTKAIDFIYYKPAGAFRVQGHTVPQEPYASDHLPVVAKLVLQ